MRRVIVIAITGFSLAGCTSYSLDMFKSTPPSVPVQLESTPPGADARTSVGPGCKTPCTVNVQLPSDGFSVTFTLNGFQPATVPVQGIRVPGDFITPASTRFDPNPVVAQLQPAGPPPRPPHKKIMRPKRPKPPKGADQDAGAPPPPPPPPPSAR
jgi:hypothetical protein